MEQNDYVNDGRGEQKEEPREKRKGDEVVNYSGRRKRRRRKHQGAHRGIPPHVFVPSSQASGELSRRLFQSSI